MKMGPFQRALIYFKDWAFTLRCRLQFLFISKKISIISQSCLGGIIYHRLGMRFLSPTIDCYIDGEDFVKLLARPKHYMAIAPTEDKSQTSLRRYPVMVLEDIKIHCMHYDRFERAKECWDRRKTRIDFDNILVIFDSWNCHQDEHVMNEILAMPYRCLFISDIEAHKGLPNCLFLDGRYLTGQNAFPNPNPLGLSKDSYRRNVEKDYDLYGLLKKVIRKRN